MLGSSAKIYKCCIPFWPVVSHVCVTLKIRSQLNTDIMVLIQVVFKTHIGYNLVMKVMSNHGGEIVIKKLNGLVSLFVKMTCIF